MYKEYLNNELGNHFIEQIFRDSCPRRYFFSEQLNMDSDSDQRSAREVSSP